MYSLVDLAPQEHARPVLVVVTPGFDEVGFLPLARALVADGDAVHLLVFDCAGQDATRLADEIAEASAAIPGSEVIVAHGLGATIALMAAPRTDASRLVLLAPVLDLQPVEATSFLADQPAPAAVDLAVPLAWNGRSLAEVLLGDHPPPLACMPGPFAADVQGWVRAGHVPLALEDIPMPVWMAVSLGDDVATVEAVVPASRRLPHRALVRLGLNRFDPQDYSHGQMLTAHVPIALAAREVRR
jgi:alpha-beta hydrolase superfamily lysophospholipase